jgi:hypothetical protein
MTYYKISFRMFKKNCRWKLPVLKWAGNTLKECNEGGCDCTEANCPVLKRLEDVDEQGKCENCKHFKHHLDYANCGECNNEHTQLSVVVELNKTWLVTGEFCCKNWQPLSGKPKEGK